MASEIVTVCLSGVDGRDYVDSLTEALARHDERSDDPRWEAQWRVVGGLPLADDQAADARVLMSDGLCAGAPRGLLGLERKWAEAAAAAARLWDQWRDFATAYPPARSLEQFYTESAADPVGYDSGRALADYLAQPVVPATPFLADGSTPTPVRPSLELDPVGWFGLARDEYARRRAARALPTAGLLTLEGEWLDPDQILRGASPAEKMLDDFRNRLSYFDRADAYLRGLPPKCFVVRVRVRT